MRFGMVIGRKWDDIWKEIGLDVAFHLLLCIISVLHRSHGLAGYVEQLAEAQAYERGSFGLRKWRPL